MHGLACRRVVSFCNVMPFGVAFVIRLLCFLGVGVDAPQRRQDFIRGCFCRGACFLQQLGVFCLRHFLCTLDAVIAPCFRVRNVFVAFLSRCLGLFLQTGKFTFNSISSQYLLSASGDDTSDGFDNAVYFIV